MEVSDADRGIDPASRDGSHHGAGEVAFLQDPDPGSRRGHVGDQLLVARPLEDGHGQILDAYVPREGDPAQVVRDRVVEVDRTAHRFAGRVADALRVALTKQTGTCERRGFGRLHQLERELAARLIGRYPAPLLFHVSTTSRTLRAAPRAEAPSGRRSAGTR